MEWYSINLPKLGVWILVEKVIETALPKVDKPEIKNALLKQGGNINVNGVFMKILNVTHSTVTLRPHKTMVFEVQGVPCKLKKMTHLGDLVLTTINKGQFRDAVPIGTEFDRN